MKIRIAALVSTILLASQSVQALRCDRQVIQEGDHQIDVVELCGEPAWRQNWYRDHSAEVGRIDRRSGGDSSTFVREGVSVETTIEEWIYDFGPRRLKHRILFENGYVVKITPLVK